MIEEKSIHDEFVYSFMLQKHRKLLFKKRPKIKKDELEVLAIKLADEEMAFAKECKAKHDYENSYIEFDFGALEKK
jgi:hypothetical protein